MRDYVVPPIPDSIWKNPIHFTAFGFGAGALPIAPGTFGTLMAIPFYLVFQNLSPLGYLIFFSNHHFSQHMDLQYSLQRSECQ